jgi:amidase
MSEVVRAGEDGRLDEAGAFISRVVAPVSEAPDGPLADLTFGVKDIIDVAGEVTGCGNPRIRATAAPAAADAPVVAMLRAAGARYAGKTHTVELAFSLDGRNVHYGTPRNTAAPDRVPGGSSSGSASAVAAGLVDVALGSDTGGSVRGPGSMCGLIGLRTTHARIPLDGVMPLASSLDTLGWFARDAATYARVGAVLLGEDVAGSPLRRALVATDVGAWLDGGEVVAAVEAAMPRLLEPFDTIDPIVLAPEGLQARYDVLRVTQAREAYEAHRAWLEAGGWELIGAPIRARFEVGARVTDAELDAAWSARGAVRAQLAELLRDDTVIALPTLPAVAPLVAGPEADLEAFRQRSLPLLCSAGLGGLPQISIPLATVAGVPLGLSLIGPAGRDRALIDLAVRILGEG